MTLSGHIAAALAAPRDLTPDERAADAFLDLERTLDWLAANRESAE